MVAKSGPSLTQYIYVREADGSNEGQIHFKCERTEP